MGWRAATLVYLLGYGGLTAADFLTTNAGVRAGAGREVNQVVADASTGGLSARYLALQAGLGGLCGWAFAAGYRRLQADGPPGRYSSPAVLVGTATGPGVPAVRYLLGAATVLGMKAVVPASNLGVILAGWSVFGAARRRLGGDAAPGWLVLGACVLLAAAAGFLLAAPAVRWLVGHVPRGRPDAEPGSVLSTGGS